MFSCRTAKLRLFRHLKNCMYPSAKSLSSANINVIIKSAKKMANFNVDHAILRYVPQDEKFTFSILLQSGKVCNFQRPIVEDISSFEQRIVANLAKKFKTTEVTAKVQLPTNFNQDMTSMKDILDHLMANTIEAKFQINDGNGAQVVVNPPEVSVMKFYNRAFVGFPIMPHKFEASSNFVPEKSLFKWKATKDQSLIKTLTQVKKGSSTNILQDTDLHESWTTVCESNNMMLVPDDELKGSLLRLTCTPSNGQSYGIPLITDVPSLVEQLPVSQLVFEERLSRLSPNDSTNVNTLRFISYNILADTYATAEWFSASPPTALDLDYRAPLICKELESYNGDVICLQEVDGKVFDGILTPFLQLTRNYRGILSLKSGATKEGVAVFYNPLKLNLLEHETIDVGEKIKDLPFYNTLPDNLTQRIHERNTIVQVSVFENKNSEQSLLVLANTHLYFHPNADHIRLLQTIVCIRTLEEKVELLKKKFPGLKIRTFFCGDFNCTPPYGAFRLLTTGKVTRDDEDWICHEPEKISPGIDFEHNLNLISSHPGQELTNIVVNFEGCIDYILYQSEHAKVTNIYPAPSKSTIASIIGKNEKDVALPTFNTPSDHLPLITDFTLL